MPREAEQTSDAEWKWEKWTKNKRQKRWQRMRWRTEGNGIRMRRRINWCQMKNNQKEKGGIMFLLISQRQRHKCKRNENSHLWFRWVWCWLISKLNKLPSELAMEMEKGKEKYRKMKRNEIGRHDGQSMSGKLLEWFGDGWMIVCAFCVRNALCIDSSKFDIISFPK